MAKYSRRASSVLLAVPETKACRKIYPERSSVDINAYWFHFSGGCSYKKSVLHPTTVGRTNELPRRRSAILPTPGVLLMRCAIAHVYPGFGAPVPQPLVCTGSFKSQPL